MMIDRFKNLKKHLQTQIKAADRIGSGFVYILREEAEICLQLADAEETFLSDPVYAEIEGGGSTWWYVCSECHGSISPYDVYCRGCGRKIQWEKTGNNLFEK